MIHTRSELNKSGRKYGVYLFWLVMGLFMVWLLIRAEQMDRVNMKIDDGCSGYAMQNDALLKEICTK